MQSVQINTTSLNINAFFRSFVTYRLHYFAIFFSAVTKLELNYAFFWDVGAGSLGDCCPTFRYSVGNH